MENKNYHPPPPETETAPPPPPKSASPAPSPPQSRRNNSGDHISLSSPAESYSSPLHSKHNSDEHISLSPPEQNSPARSSADSAHITIRNSRGSSPDHERNRPMDRSSLESEYITFDHGRRLWLAVMEEPNMVAPKTDPGHELAGGGGSGIRQRRVSPSLSILRRGEREKMVRKAALGLRVFGLLFCLVSFAVMAADRNQGWALDSFDRYKEFICSFFLLLFTTTNCIRE
ncbi:hypothetical protein SASPL_143214 [Salvia splendens]|uniref:CASP-like protein n=1 Tax=Salvia splendens TaxID=180675 RepID=A0A8X8WMX6_SALSN|nr:hypothetical protein SASPL_143214 [Salvia splendens]